MHTALGTERVQAYNGISIGQYVNAVYADDGFYGVVSYCITEDSCLLLTDIAVTQLRKPLKTRRQVIHNNSTEYEGLMHIIFVDDAERGKAS